MEYTANTHTTRASSQQPSRIAMDKSADHKSSFAFEVDIVFAAFSHALTTDVPAEAGACMVAP